MAIFISALVIIICLLAAYALVGRPWLKEQSWAQGFFTWVDPFESALFKKSETILMGRLLWVGGLFVSLYDGLATFVHSLDITPLTTRIMDWLHVPQDLRGLTISSFIMALGLMINNLRAKITKPLELVAVPDAQITPAAAQAIAQADAAKEKAVQAVAEAKS